MNENSLEVYSMHINSNLVAAAKASVMPDATADWLAEIPGYNGMFVGFRDCQKLQPLHYFEKNDVGYAIGPLKT
jgi:hypothetical protein